MSVLHLGGRPLVTETILQIAEQHDFNTTYHALETPLGAASHTQSRAELIETLSASSVILFHRLEALLLLGCTASEITPILQRLKKSSKLFFYSYDEYCERWNSDLSTLIHESNFSKIFLGSPHYAEKLSSWCSLPCALNISKIEPLIREPRAQQLHLLYLAHPNLSAERTLLENSFRQLREMGLRFSSAIIDSQDITSLEDLDALIGSCDLFIEQVQQPYFGSLAVYAMAKGKPVVSGNDPKNRNYAFHYSLSPVLAATISNLQGRLEAIIREPLCLRDLSKRSRQYVETYHNAELLYGELLDLAGR